MTFSFFLRRWHASRSSGYTSFPVKDSALQTSPSNSLFDLIPLGELRRSQSFLFSNIEHYPGMIAPNRWFVCVIMNCRFWKSATQKKHDQILMQNCPFFFFFFFFRSFVFSGKLSKLKSSSISSSLDSSFNLLLVKTTVVNSAIYNVQNTVHEMAMAERCLHYTANIGEKR